MSQTAEEFFRSDGRRWAMITREKAYKNAVDTAPKLHSSFQVLGKGLAEMKGVGDLVLAQQAAIMEFLAILETLAAVPHEYSEQDEPPEDERYPDPMEEFAESRITKRRK